MPWRIRSAGLRSRFVPTWRKDLAVRAALRRTYPRYIVIAIGSADEMRVWLRYCLDLDYLDDATWQAWRDEYQEIARMLEGLKQAVSQRV